MSDVWSTLFPKAARNLAEYLVDGTETFASYASDIETADSDGHYIYILGWMLDIDFAFTGTLNQNYGKKGESYFKGDKTLLKLLTTATAKGVEVRALIWDNPLYPTKNKRSIDVLGKLPNTSVFLDAYTYSPDQAIKTIRRARKLIIQLVDAIRPLLNRTFLRTRVSEQFDIPADQLLDLIVHYVNTANVGAHHEKVLIVKGRQGLIAYCGGLDINPNRFTSYHDGACRLIGPAAHEILGRFVRRWHNHSEATSIALTGENDVKPEPLGPLVGRLVNATVVGTFNSPDGQVRDHSARDAYLKILEKAQNYIYIEDQYMVNLDVARALNKKIKERLFKMLVMVVQDESLTRDILIPNRKRKEFFSEVTRDTTDEEKQRCAFFMFNADVARRASRHPGLHAKTLIVDDDVAMIGSANLNQRSFTLDSETAVVVFDDGYDYRNHFAYRMRQKVWSEFILKPSGLGSVEWEELVRHVYSEDDYSVLVPFFKSVSMLDVDDQLTDTVSEYAVPLTWGVTELLRDDFSTAVETVSVLNSDVARREIMDTMWENIIDPQVPDSP